MSFSGKASENCTGMDCSSTIEAHSSCIAWAQPILAFIAPFGALVRFRWELAILRSHCSLILSSYVISWSSLPFFSHKWSQLTEIS